MSDTGIPDAAAALKAKGNDFFVKKQYTEAAEQYSRILDDFVEKTPEAFYKVIYCNRAACFIELGQYSQAIRDLNCVLKDKEGTPSSILPKAYFRLARCYYEFAAYDEAKVQLGNYEKLVNATTPIDPAISSLKKAIDDKINELNSKSTAMDTDKDGGAGPQFRSFLYEARVLGMGPDESFVRSERAPASLCVPRPPEIPTKALLDSLARKHHETVLRSRQWRCWNCNRPATGLVHTPSSYLHKEGPSVLDFIQPICYDGGECDRMAREEIGQVMAEAARMGITT